MYGQLVIGPPGSGKSTYCKAMRDFLTSMNRKCAIVNLDPANDSLPYACEIDIRQLINLSDVMRDRELGPNGALIYCVEYLRTNLDWLRAKIVDELQDGFDYVLFDFPGQIELYTNYGDVKEIVGRLIKEDGHRLVTVFLTDSHYCTEPSKFVSILIAALTSMIRLETPHVNVLSKVDLIEQFAALPFNLEYFCEVMDLNHLLDLMQDDPFTRKHRKLTEALCGVVEDYGLVSFRPLNVEDKTMMLNVLREADKANGYYLRQSEEQNPETLINRSDHSHPLHIQSVHEKYCQN